MTALPFTLAQTPAIDRWLRFHDDGTLTICTGKVELGQGISTAIAIICAEELDVAMSRVRVQTGDTHAAPNEFMTAGSGSIEGSGAAVKQVCAEARGLLLAHAARALNVPEDQLIVEDGLVRPASDPESNEAISYWELMRGRLFDADATGEATPKDPAKHRVIGRGAPRVDLAAKIAGGEPVFIQDLDLPDLLHGRVLRPPGHGYELTSLPAAAVRLLPGVVEVVVDGSFVGVVAEREEQVERAVEALEAGAAWRGQEVPTREEGLHDFMAEHVSHRLPVIDGTPQDEPPPPPLPAPAGAATHLEATYRKPYHMHGSIGPSAAVARWSDGGLTVYSHSQGPFVLQAAMAQVLDTPPETIHVIHRENAGCYGHNGADDAAMDAALLARAVPNRHVMLKWSREDEHAWEPYSPAMLMKVAASLDPNQRIARWDYEVVSHTHGGRPTPRRSGSHFIAAWHKENPIPEPTPRPGMGNHSGIHRNADPYYDLGNRRIIKNLVGTRVLRTSSTRGLGAYGNVFAIESFMDEVAVAAETDPASFRIGHLSDPRAIAVIERARDEAETRARGTPVDGMVSGRGMAFARYKNAKCYAAIFVDLTVDEASFEVHLDHAVIAGDAGQIIDPDGLANQLEGGFIQGASWTLKEAVRFDAGGVTSRDWESYPILRFSEVPTVDVHLLDQPVEPSLGAGEATQGPAAAAIANALYDATGLRVRDLPLTPDTIRHAALSTDR